MIEKAPIVFTPYLKSVIWGGDKICRYKGISQPEPNIGESWEISAVPGHESVVAEGLYKGMTLTGLIDRFGAELLGDKVMKRYNGKFPLLIKLIDAADNLSVQVHPDDELAMKRHNSLGKTEMWYIIQADEDAKIYAGLNTKMTPEDYVRRVADGTFADTLAVHESHAGDVFFLPAGRVHAIGAGNLLAEIQESSDITYRIYDYNRRDSSGNYRELHTDLAKDAIDYKLYPQYKTSPISPNVTSAIIRCNYFNVERIIVNGYFEIVNDEDSFIAIMCIEGDAVFETSSSKLEVHKGCVTLLPAIVDSVTVKGNVTFLIIQVP